MHSATVLKGTPDELAALGDEEALLAMHLRRLLRSYDIQAIARLLARLPAIEAMGWR